MRVGVPGILEEISVAKPPEQREAPFFELRASRMFLARGELAVSPPTYPGHMAVTKARKDSDWATLTDPPPLRVALSRVEPYFSVLGH